MTSIITYRLKDDLVYVPPAATFEEAVTIAKDVFPTLADVDQSRIYFTMSAALEGSRRRPVRIGPMAWKAVTSTVFQWEILDVVVTPEPVTSDVVSESGMTMVSQHWTEKDMDSARRSPSPRNWKNIFKTK